MVTTGGESKSKGRRNGVTFPRETGISFSSPAPFSADQFPERAEPFLLYVFRAEYLQDLLKIHV